MDDEEETSEDDKDGDQRCAGDKEVVVGLVLLSVFGGVGGVFAITVLWRRWTVIIGIA